MSRPAVPLRSLVVFCGSNSGRDGRHVAAARELGALLSRRRVTLVYGGGSVGLMGALADEVLREGGEVVGVIPRFLVVEERAHPRVERMRVVETMHERKAAMAEMADAFLALPGGFGTLDELAEALTWSQLGLHSRPVGLWNVGGFFDLLLGHLDRLVAEEFLLPEHREILLVDDRADRLLDRMEAAIERAVPPPRRDLERA